MGIWLDVARFRNILCTRPTSRPYKTWVASELERNVASAEPSSQSNDQAHRSSESSPVQDSDDEDSFLDDIAGNNRAASDDETSPEKRKVGCERRDDTAE